MSSCVMLALGLMVGAVIGYVLGREDPRRCADCLSNEAGRYADGQKAGYRDGVEATVERVRKRGTEARNTYTITKDELERIRAEMVD